MCILSNFRSNVKIIPKSKIHKFESRLERLFFDFRGMYMALLVFDNQEYCTLIDKFLSLVSRLNVLFIRPNGFDYPVFCRRTNAGDMFWKSQVLGDN